MYNPSALRFSVDRCGNVGGVFTGEAFTGLTRFAYPGMLLAAVFSVAFGLHAYGEGERATGFRPSPRSETLRVREIGSPHRARLLQTSPEALPAKWDSRDVGWVSSIKDQAQIGSCWSFAAIATIETQLLKAGKGERDFSEKNMVNLAASPISFDDGGDYNLAAGYLLRWSGPVDETNDLYVGTTNQWIVSPSPALISELHIQDIVRIPDLDGTVESRNAFKCAIANYGIVAATICWDFDCEKDETYYHGGTGSANHAITVVGWDDDYPTNKFKYTPPGNGAWLIKNSWGTRWGDKGCYWVSYYDATFGLAENVVFLPPEDGDARYDVVHGHDCSGPGYDTSVNGTPSFDCDLQAVVFTATWNERLAAVGIWTTLFPNPYEISVYTNVTRHTMSRADEVECYNVETGDGYLPESTSPIEGGGLACTVTGTFSHSGFTTVPLENEISLEPGSSYAIVYRQTGSALSTVVSYVLPLRGVPPYGEVLFKPGNGYIGWTRAGGAISWADAYDAGLYAKDKDGWALCIKAYTRHAVAAPRTDAPAATDDGMDMLLSTAMTNATLFADTYSFEPLAGLVGANGRSLWASYLAGFDPTDPDDGEFTVGISMTNNVPYLEWKPNLGSRTYTIYGTESLSSPNWQPVEDLADTNAKFFKVKVSR